MLKFEKTMNTLRLNAIHEYFTSSKLTDGPVSKKISTYFAENVFDLKKAREFLSDEAYNSLLSSIKSQTKIDRKMGDQIASALKSWAETKGVTHYTHWFQPLSGATAEKHDSFFSLKGDGHNMEEFNGAALIQQEPDASSFPSGGLRATFEARGYSAWDPTSPPFIIEMRNGKTLCIPTIFVSYTGQSLDAKTPLLRSKIAVEKAAVDVCQYFDRNITSVTTTLGWEQEYFVVDEAIAGARPDLMMTGRTLFGQAPAKGQQLEDHYFGAIPERVYAFMRDFEQEAYKLGIPLKTRHNEVAPNQFECAPIFEEINLAIDHNILLMDIMTRLAKNHKLRVLLHEKPFAKMNGSGKHNNWSMATNTGVNLLSPGRTPKTNLMFLTFFVATIKAVHDNADILRSSIASAGNDHRLGANEAPPAIISIFIGQYLNNVLNEIEKRVSAGFDVQDEAMLKLDIHKNIPELLLDNTDRNRTSPFAFTGNKFEFRAPGSSSNPAIPMTVLNTIVADVLTDFKTRVDELINGGEKKEIAILQVIQKYILDSKNILFEGDGYSGDWESEAMQRGLENIKTTPLALDAMVSEKSKSLFKRHQVYDESELEARYEILLENYTKKIQIESRTMGEMSSTYILPPAIKYQNILIENIRGLKELGLNEYHYESQFQILGKISEHINSINKNVKSMIEARKVANKIEDSKERAMAYCFDVKKYFDHIRYHADKLELLVDDELWELPKYRELFFMK